ncbi:unnamed protein product [Mytilus edulis]|uniref:CCHC-type domain-containing protein n=1 Tax=Mytilus edulis TaxID=6550 RepID=A0A8S3S925_MYTED|nr:unnamed protein product [Mytilus edulis]
MQNQKPKKNTITSEPEPESPIRIQRSEEREGSTRFSPEDALSLFTQSLDLTLRKHKEELFKEIDTRIGAKEAERSWLNRLLNSELEKTLKLIEKDSPALAIQYLEKSIKALKERNKLLRIADKYGWDVVDEYIDDPITEGTDDATKLRQTDYRAKAKRRDKVRTRPTPYIPEPESSQVPQDEPFRKTSSASTREVPRNYKYPAAQGSQTRTGPRTGIYNQNEYFTSSQPTDRCYYCNGEGHWAYHCPKRPVVLQSDETFRFKHSHWESLKHFSNPDLKALTVSLCSVVTASKSENTLKKYKGYFKRFKYWCLKYNLPFLPTTVCTVAIYLNYLIQSGVSTAVLNAAYYSIKWEHDLNLYDSILNDKLLDMVLEGGIRLLSKPLKRKEPITPTILKSIIAKFDKNDNLPGLRICAMMLIGFSGFLRYDELAHIRSSDLTFNDSHLQINIQKKFLPLFGDPETTIYMIYMTRVVTIYFYYLLN